jgi:hypothetical protein
MKIQIKDRFTGSVLFEHEAEGNTISITLQAAVNARANLARANLDGANLARAYLAGANLDGAYLAGANLARANLAGAYLARANLAGANLDVANLARANLAGAYLDGAYLARAYLAGAYLAGANLDGANLAGANLDVANLDGANLDGAYLDGAYLARAYLAGERPVFQVGPIGSRCAYLVSFLTTVGVKIRAGCFFGSRDEFAAKVDKEHGDSIHGEEYRAALTLIDAHARLWSKAETVAEAVQVEAVES